MPAYIVSYDLHSEPATEYKKLFKAIKTNYPLHRKHLKSDWIVITPKLAKDIFSDLIDSQLGSDNGIVEVDETFWGNNNKKPENARGYAHKMKVLSLVERHGEKRSFHVPQQLGLSGI